MVDPITAVQTASSILDLAKAAWKIGSALIKLYQDTKCIDATVEKLAGEVKSLSHECDLVHAELEEVVAATKTGASSPYDVDGRLWSCLSTKVDECGLTIQELDLLVRDVATESSDFVGQAQRQMKLNRNRDNFANIRVRIRTHTDGLRTALLVINIKVAHIAPGYANRELTQKLDELHRMVEDLQKSMEAAPHTPSLDADATLVQCAREVITKGTTMYEASLAAPSVLGGQGAANSNVRVAEWVSTLNALRREERTLDQSEIGSTQPSVFSGDEGRTNLTSGTSVSVADHKARNDVVDEDSDDELAIDLAKAALETGTQAFETAAWQEADSLLQETLSLLQQLPKGQRGFCDTVDLQFKLAVCAYHIQEPADAEGALASLLQQPASSDEHRRHICEVAHLLSLLYIRMNQLDRARSSCEKALQARRRLLGKQNDASLTSMALMARIYEMLQNRTLAKVYLAMIPEARKPGILHVIDDSLGDLGPRVDAIDRTSRHARSPSEDSNLGDLLNQLDLTRSNSVATSGMRPVAFSAPALATSPSVTEVSVISTPRESDATLFDAGSRERLLNINTAEPYVSSHSRLPETPSDFSGKTEAPPALPINLPPPVPTEEQPTGLSRDQILDNLGFRPKGPLEKAVCRGAPIEEVSRLITEHPTRTSGLRRQFKVTPRPTPLHFAALFGEVEIAEQILLTSPKYMNVDLPSLVFWTVGTPFHWAVLSRQADVLRLFLITSPDVLATLADGAPQMSREMYAWWLSSTISKSERSQGTTVQKQFIDLVKVLVEHGWEIDRGLSGIRWTLLHYAVCIARNYDPHGVVITYMCEQGANPFKRNSEGHTPYDFASQDSNTVIVGIFDRYKPDKRETTAVH